jgi:signal transduction histidine kinase
VGSGTIEAPSMSAHPAPSLAGSTVLIVDDTPANLGVLVDTLEDRGFSVAVAQDGEEGLVRARLIRPDLVLLDVTMPGMDGFEVCRRLKAIARTQDIPVIFMTALAETEDKVTGFAVGAVDFVTKPFQMEEVLARITAHLTLRKMQEQIAVQQELRHTAQKVEAEAERLVLLERLVNVQEQERLRIARELHDQMGQNLTGLSLGLRSLEPLIGTEEGRQTLRWLEALTAKIGSDVHRTAWELRPTSLDDVGLVRALETYVGDWAGRFGITVDLHVGNVDGDRFPAQVETTVFRVMQEAMTNVLKHAGASTVSLVLERRGDLLQIIVEDDGKGFDSAITGGAGQLGLAGMRERLALVSGTLTIDSVVGSGTTLYFRITLPPPAAAGEVSHD